MRAGSSSWKWVLSPSFLFTIIFSQRICLMCFIPFPRNLSQYHRFLFPFEIPDPLFNYNCMTREQNISRKQSTTTGSSRKLYLFSKSSATGATPSCTLFVSWQGERQNTENFWNARMYFAN